MLTKVFIPNSENKKHFFRHLGRICTLRFTKGINCIIGPNASGKTTILNLFRWNVSNDDVVEANKEIKVTIPTYSNLEYFYKAVFDKPISKENILFYNPREYQQDDAVQEFMQAGDFESMLNLSMYRQSEAECAAFYFKNWFIKNREKIKEDNTVIIIDEPENSNDLLTISYFSTSIRNWCNNNPHLQILMSTHSPAFMQYADNIVELEKGYLKRLCRDYRKILDNIENRN